MIGTPEIANGNGRKSFSHEGTRSRKKTLPASGERSGMPVGGSQVPAPRV
ncbi:MAG: hypothetical protein KME26_11405 [Oscillatoria princeps RMCB-10]|nr:hypothetical protein [Oscillatoria princeps RMCB-10]